MTARSRRIGTLLGLSDLCELLLPHLTAVEALAGPGAMTQAAAAAEAAKQLLGHARVDSGALEEAIELRDRLATLVLHGHDRMRVYVALLLK